jgi:molybdate transport system substrate-binding protein
MISTLCVGQLGAMTPRSAASRRVAGVLMAVVLAAAASGHPAAQRPNEVLVFAAASLKTALDTLAPVMERAVGVRMRTSFAATSALARQIEAGAPADVFVSADLDWMDYLAERRLVRSETRVNLLGNRLVLIAPRQRPVRLTIGPGFPLAAALGGDGRLAVADPRHVPAGRYAKAALESLGVWSSVASRLAPAENVRAALLFVARGESPLGIVYHTDALAEPDVVIVDTFPASSHPSIVYPAAITSATANPAAADVLAFLRSPTARAAFERLGFSTPSP